MSNIDTFAAHALMNYFDSQDSSHDVDILRKALQDFIAIDDADKSKKPLFCCQGQALVSRTFHKELRKEYNFKLVIE